MCGFAGFLSKMQDAEIANNWLIKMGNSISHRGPDDQGQWYHPADGIGLSHRRLAIVDLSPAGHQPMASLSKRYVIAFNGEIYNHLAIRDELAEKCSFAVWRGHSDTETILAAFDHWGIEQTVEKLVGMFSIAVWDLQQKELVLVRDRMGEKPLYYGWCQGVFLFGSELKALRCHPAFDAEINRDALALYMQYSYVPAPYSIYKSVSKLQQGCMLKVSLEHPGDVEVRTYWSLQQIHARELKLSAHYSDQEIIEQLHQMIKGSVQAQLMSDVPVGAFLSGGVDSSLIVSLMQSLSSSPVKTFTIGFDQREFDEAHFASKVASHLGTDHTELYLSDQDTLNVVPKLASIYDEPFADSSQIPTFLVSMLAKSKVAVALSGDAGDELFSGYSRYQHCADTWRRLQESHPVTRKLMPLARFVSPFVCNQISHLFRIQPEGRNAGHRLAKMANVSNADDFISYYQSMLSHTTLAHQLVIFSNPVSTVFTDCKFLPPKLESLMLVDGLTYLPDDILAKVDRASMAVSLESRIPLLDYRIVEFAQQMPQHLKVNAGQNKWCLRQILDKYVPKKLIERPKKGFGVPLAAWLRGPLKEWAESLLDPELIYNQKYLDPKIVRQMWMQHQSGVADWHFQLWNVLIFQHWLSDQNHHKN
ncbi:asparagine synthase (glutamine-hydrolyzing) [Rheinheimera sp. SA_1]|uniref:asparagine synthase (glutamine-hydrolyzing) n=1 Tax=Rheinheimera sp. SA_1 TaxID=1827365 RepID=UPI00080157FC|nr:asparagine synthase (glutamine-hydrolyzing) [Rheinheimera sp. SA_1]OBP15336.1 asparagine synthase (glutamine-hydrolyzing) [Rheinheimera sp. SA_1]